VISEDAMMTIPHKICRSRLQQSGSTLITSLIILIVLMLIGVTAMNTSDTQYKLAANLQYENLAMNNAETAAGAAERWLESKAATAPSAPDVATLPNPLSNAMTWTNADSVAFNNDDNQRYAIGFVKTFRVPTAGVGLNCADPANAKNFDCVNTYQITARGVGHRGAIKFVQTYYAVPLK
jgi:Tfp pilus assembly protein PilX